MANYRVVKRVHNDQMGYCVQKHKTLLFGFVRYWEDVQKHLFDEYTGNYYVLFFRKTEHECYDYIKTLETKDKEHKIRQELIKNWK